QCARRGGHGARAYLGAGRRAGAVGGADGRGRQCRRPHPQADALDRLCRPRRHRLCRLQDDLGRRARSVSLRRPGWQELTAAARRIGSRALAALLVAAFLWGVAEAIYFFVVADVLLTFIAVAYGLRAGLVASLAAALGAACGRSEEH